MPRVEQDLQKQLDSLRRGVVEIVPEGELVDKLKRSIKEDSPLIVKLGLDPTAPDIHLGHTVVLQKLRQFQKFGHQVVIVLGDYTGRVGDPSGRSETRQQLTEDQVLANARTYEEQIFKVLNKDKTEVVFNSQWLATLSFADVLNMAAKYTVARMLERDDFEKRYREGLPIGVHEFFYPLMQGYDSVALKADVELGGTDQKFNLLMGRHLQKEFDLPPQVAITMPIIEGLDGVNKMSKSLGNYIGVDEPANEMYGKTMSIPDELMMRYFELVTQVPLEEVQKIAGDLKGGSLHPRDVKMRLGREIVRTYHGAAAAREAEQQFKQVFQQRELPDEIPAYKVTDEILEDGQVALPKLLVAAGLTASNSEARRMVKQKAVKINGETVADPNLRLDPKPDTIIRVGKRRFARLT